MTSGSGAGWGSGSSSGVTSEGYLFYKSISTSFENMKVNVLDVFSEARMITYASVESAKYHFPTSSSSSVVIH